MNARTSLWWAAAVLGAMASVACSGSGTGNGDAGGTPVDAGPPPIDAGATTTLTAAINGNVTSAITVVGIVTAQAGVPHDYPTWYIEDPAGGASSGVAVYCDPLGSCPAGGPAAPGLGVKVALSGAISTFKGQRQIIPTAQVVLATDAGPASIPTVSATDLSPSGNSSYRGVYVKYSGPTLTVDSVDPPVLRDTECETPGPDGGLPDGGLPRCSPLCEPPIYSGFQANDGMGHEIFVEAPFFYTDPLQSSPECLTQAGVVPVRVGMTFSALAGIVDVDPYAGMQFIAPVQTSDYATP